MNSFVAATVLLAAGFTVRAAGLDALKDALAARRTRALLVMRGGKIVYEWHAADSAPDRRHGTASLAKALVGGMSLATALSDGRMGVDDPAAKFIPAWRGDPLKSKITIRHLATHSSGIEDAEQDGKPHMELPGWKGAFWRREPDPFSIAVAQAPVLFAPGTSYAYSNPGMAALACAVTASLEGAPQQDLRALLKERVMGPLGVPDEEWSIGYGRAYEVDGLRLYANWGGGSFTARATARVGQLMLQRGRWNGRQLFPRAWVEKMVTPAGTPLPDRRGGDPNPASGLCWWTNADGVWGAVPRDAFAGAGAGHQIMLVAPSLDLVVVRYGAALVEPAGRAGFWRAAYEHLFQPVMAALNAPPPYPPSPVVRKITFAPEASIVRQAIDSDNWPITWMDDDAQFTSYGDGWGFEPRTELKLSQGFARIIGAPEAFQAENVRSPTGERTGDGKAGPKASGMLMVNGVLYMWVRNTGNAQLAWSEDRGRSWQWGFRIDTSFGSPAFLNFGRNYGGARDGYVYAYSQDGPSAYESYDGIVLARAPKERMRDRAAWELFARLDAAGRPVWTDDIRERGPVFTYPGRCQRVDVVYNPGIQRYLMALGYDHSGGWGIFDAPEPWGPWTTAFHTGNWGLGGTHGYRLPPKWISRDGRGMQLIFSGVKPNDAFCARAMTLEVTGPPYPPSKAIKLTWDDYANKVIIGDARRTGDNWPSTWGDDDVLYTSLGDGSGFSNRQPRLTLAFARIFGDSPALHGEDLPSDIDAPMGGGSSGIKSSGLLMVDRVLYLFVRNYKVDGDYRHSRLAWSRNYGKNWTWADWHFSDTFGCPDFVQFGPNYRGARDRFVYIVSQANNDAYGFSPDIVMARVPRDRIASRDAWEFFAGPDMGGRPQWSRDIAQRWPAFTDPRGAQRISMSYNAALKRYILTASHRVGATAHNASLGVFDAPEPWGPWTTLYYDDHWSANDRTYHHKFPPRYMSRDGRVMWLVYSGLDGGNYAFCLRKATLEAPASR
ncbi:MAG: serine hydrolase [Acidobacteriota bacterium]